MAGEQPPCHVDVADPAVVDELDGVLEVRMRATLRAAAHDPFVLARGVDEKAAFAKIVRDRFFHIGMLARLASKDAGHRVPMVAARDDNGVDRGVVHDAPQVGLLLRGLSRASLQLAGALAHAVLIRIAHGGHFDSIERRNRLHHTAAAAAHADDGDAQAVVRSCPALRCAEKGRGSESGGGGEKGTAFDGFHEDLT